jgi:hypothetical protein
MLSTCSEDGFGPEGQLLLRPSGEMLREDLALRAAVPDDSTVVNYCTSSAGVDIQCWGRVKYKTLRSFRSCLRVQSPCIRQQEEPPVEEVHTVHGRREEGRLELYKVSLMHIY